jgi:hypothetical protein
MDLSRFKLVPHISEVLMVSESGEVLRPGGSRDRRIPTTPLSWKVPKRGYAEVRVRRAGRRYAFAIHRLVALAWVRGYEPGLTVNHIDGNKLNNNATNLEWVSLSENVKKAWQTGLAKCPGKGEKHPKSKLTEADVEEIRQSPKSAKYLADLYGIHWVHVYSIRSGRSWKHSHR